MFELIQYRELAERIFADIRELTSDGMGVTRESYGESEAATANYLQMFATSVGLNTSKDRAGNLVFRFPNVQSDIPVVCVGSHLDSVPQGGNFDGLAGVVAGLLCMVARQQIAQALPFQVIGFRGEESAWFGRGCIGSSSLVGNLPATDLKRLNRVTGKSLGQCMDDIGADTDAIRAGIPLLDVFQVKAYLELHIEQGPIMVAHNLPVAAVSAIRGNFRHSNIICVGEAQHSGATPRALRRDAIFAVSDLLMRLDDLWREYLNDEKDLVVTTGILHTNPKNNAISRIPDHVTFSLEVRSRDEETLEQFYKNMHGICNIISSERGVRFEFDKRVFSKPVVMNEMLTQFCENACSARSVPFDVIPSGAGHDAAIMSNAGISSGMIFVRNENGSHNPREAMSIEDFMLGVQILSDMLVSLEA